MHALGHDAGLAARLALPAAPFNMSGNPAICLPAGGHVVRNPGRGLVYRP